MNKHLVFVYGSLRRGSPGAMSIRFPGAQFIAEAKVNGRLFDLGAYPGLQLDESATPVVGEVYEVDEELLTELDRFEGSSHYLRKQTAISIGAERKMCWTYEPDPECYPLSAVITSGDWIEFGRTKTEAT